MVRSSRILRGDDGADRVRIMEGSVGLFDRLSVSQTKTVSGH